MFNSLYLYISSHHPCTFYHQCLILSHSFLVINSLAAPSHWIDVLKKLQVSSMVVYEMILFTMVLMKCLVLGLVFQANQSISVENWNFHGEKKLNYFETLSKLHCLCQLAIFCKLLEKSWISFTLWTICLIPCKLFAMSLESPCIPTIVANDELDQTMPNNPHMYTFWS